MFTKEQLDDIIKGVTAQELEQAGRLGNQEATNSHWGPSNDEIEEVNHGVADNIMEDDILNILNELIDNASQQQKPDEQGNSEQIIEEDSNPLYDNIEKATEMLKNYLNKNQNMISEAIKIHTDSRIYQENMFLEGKINHLAEIFECFLKKNLSTIKTEMDKVLFQDTEKPFSKFNMLLTINSFQNLSTNEKVTFSCGCTFSLEELIKQWIKNKKLNKKCPKCSNKHNNNNSSDNKIIIFEKLEKLVELSNVVNINCGTYKRTGKGKNKKYQSTIQGGSYNRSTSYNTNQRSLDILATPARNFGNSGRSISNSPSTSYTNNQRSINIPATPGRNFSNSRGSKLRLPKFLKNLLKKD